MKMSHNSEDMNGYFENNLVEFKKRFMSLLKYQSIYLSHEDA